MAWKSSLPAITKMTVLMVDGRTQPRARRLAAWNRPFYGFPEAIGSPCYGDRAQQPPSPYFPQLSKRKVLKT